MEDQALMQVLLKKKKNNNDNNKNKKICKWLGHGVGRFCEKKEKKNAKTTNNYTTHL